MKGILFLFIAMLVTGSFRNFDKVCLISTSVWPIKAKYTAGEKRREEARQEMSDMAQRPERLRS